MNELVQLIMQKTGLPQDKAQESVDAMVTHLKGKLPEGLSSHLDAILASAGDGGVAELEEKAKSVVAGLNSMFGTKTE